MAKRILHVIRENNSIDGEIDDHIWWQHHDAAPAMPQHCSRMIDLHVFYNFVFVVS